jgi:hypothetical protein
MSPGVPTVELWPLPFVGGAVVCGIISSVMLDRPHEGAFHRTFWRSLFALSSQEKLHVADYIDSETERPT